MNEVKSARLNQRHDLLNALSIQAIELAQQCFESNELTPHIHFELEGCVKSVDNKKINFQQINHAFEQNGIEGILVPEYWHNQWEYVSSFSGQSPLKEAQNLTSVIHWLPQLFRQQGICETLIQPVVWSGDSAQLVGGSKSIFKSLDRQIHIPNAIQINLSVSDNQGHNLIAQGALGEHIQLSLMNRSLGCCLLYLPEEDAFERLKLKSVYGLEDELCSPNNISGGHQGSIALYRQLGKHNQKLGQEPLIVNHFNEAIVSSDNWQKTARIEHRLGASSQHYNAYVNVLFALLNMIEVIECQPDDRSSSSDKQFDRSLPLSLYDDNSEIGAISLFAQDTWFEQAVNRLEQRFQGVASESNSGLGTRIKAAILTQYLGTEAIIFQN